MLAQLQRPQADRRHTWTYSYAPAGRQAAYEPHGSRSGGARRRPIVIAWRNRERWMVRGLRRGIRSSVDRRSKSGIDGDDDDTDRPQPDSPPLFLALVGLLLSYRRAGWKRTKLVKKQKHCARVELERMSVGRVVGTMCLRPACCCGCGCCCCCCDHGARPAVLFWGRGPESGPGRGPRQHTGCGTSVRQGGPQGRSSIAVANGQRWPPERVCWLL